MANKLLVYGGATVFILILVVSIFLSVQGINNASVKNINPVSDSELSKYRSADLPEECRLPEGQDVNSWKEHLGHHQNTFYCLDYYKDIK